jgi:serine/threonine protein kinase
MTRGPPWEVPVDHALQYPPADLGWSMPSPSPDPSLPRDEFDARLAIQDFLLAQAGPSPSQDAIAEWLDVLAAANPEHRRLIDDERRALSSESVDPPRSASAPAGAWPQFPGYRVLDEIGRGGQGIVYLAEDLDLGARKVALKVLHGASALTPEARERFARSATATARLEHPGVCRIHRARLDHEPPFVVMEYVKGRSLQSMLDELRARRRELPPESMRTLVGIVKDAAQAVHAAHEQGIVHRDLKPDNILVDADGRVVVIDFGLAWAESEHGEIGSLTLDGEIFGAPAYMAPEQITGSRFARAPTADIYALGAILYECLTLHAPFEDATRAALYDRALRETVVAAGRRTSWRVPRDLETIATVALEKAPKDRFRDARAFADDLERALAGQPIRARPPSTWTHAVRWARRNPTVAASLGAVFLTLMGALLTVSWFFAREQAARQLAVLRLEAEAGESAPLAESRMRMAEVGSLAEDTFLGRFFTHRLDTRTNVVRTGLNAPLRLVPRGPEKIPAVVATYDLFGLDLAPGVTPQRWLTAERGSDGVLRLLGVDRETGIARVFAEDADGVLHPAWTLPEELGAGEAFGAAVAGPERAVVVLGSPDINGGGVRIAFVGREGSITERRTAAGTPPLATGPDDSTTVRLDLRQTLIWSQDHDEPRVASHPRSGSRHLAVCAAGTWMVSSQARYGAWELTVETARDARPLATATLQDTVTALRAIDDLILVGAADGTVRALAPSLTDNGTRYGGAAAPIVDIAVEGELIHAVDADGVVSTWERTASLPRVDFVVDGSSLSSPAFSPDGRTFVLPTSSAYATLRSLARLAPLARFRAGVQAAAFVGSDGSVHTLATGTNGNAPRMHWHQGGARGEPIPYYRFDWARPVAAGLVAARIVAPGVFAVDWITEDATTTEVVARAVMLATDAVGNLVAVVDPDGCVHVYRLGSSRPVRTIRLPDEWEANDFAWFTSLPRAFVGVAPDATILIASNKHGIRFAQPRSSRWHALPPHRVPPQTDDESPNQVWGLAVHPALDEFVLARRSGVLEVYDISRRAWLGDLDGPELDVGGVGFDPTGRVLWSAATGRGLALWRSAVIEAPDRVPTDPPARCRSVPAIERTSPPRARVPFPRTRAPRPRADRTQPLDAHGTERRGSRGQSVRARAREPTEALRRDRRRPGCLARRVRAPTGPIRPTRHDQRRPGLSPGLPSSRPTHRRGPGHPDHVPSLARGRPRRPDRRALRRRSGSAGPRVVRTRDRSAEPRCRSLAHRALRSTRARRGGARRVREARHGSARRTPSGDRRGGRRRPRERRTRRAR